MALIKSVVGGDSHVDQKAEGSMWGVICIFYMTEGGQDHRGDFNKLCMFSCQYT